MQGATCGQGEALPGRVGGEAGRRVSLLCRPPAQDGLWTLGLRSRARPADFSASIPPPPPRHVPSRPHRKLSCGASADAVRGRGGVVVTSDRPRPSLATLPPLPPPRAGGAPRSTCPSLSRRGCGGAGSLRDPRADPETRQRPGGGVPKSCRFLPAPRCVSPPGTEHPREKGAAVPPGYPTDPGPFPGLRNATVQLFPLRQTRVTPKRSRFPPTLG